MTQSKNFFACANFKSRKHDFRAFWSQLFFKINKLSDSDVLYIFLAKLYLLLLGRNAISSAKIFTKFFLFSVKSNVSHLQRGRCVLFQWYVPFCGLLRFGLRRKWRKLNGTENWFFKCKNQNLRRKTSEKKNKTNYRILYPI